MTTEQGTPTPAAIKLAREFVSDPDRCAQVKMFLRINGMPAVADLIDEAVVLAREILRVAGKEQDNG